ncbi:DUF4387 domain-containing protein [Pueribacillus theae]|uniref:DUF4387 domain-containing protein n=1 Tax=Pueribacillus theae TaxID=2171751 RepID=A0A2U1JRK7_9BACI|nr:DUF4387 domain-containing protein [Pueribacillus theae]PWA07801.1 DUF4387 domain-containing protein [Pueribacillus theae]
MGVLKQYLEVLRSKNSGPFEITIDLIFKNREVFQQVIENEIITKKTISALYDIKESSILCVEGYTPARAIKITMAREKSSGSYGERDTLGAQQHAPLLYFQIPDFK